jgi:hypothetical protein
MKSQVGVIPVYATGSLKKIALGEFSSQGMPLAIETTSAIEKPGLMLHADILIILFVSCENAEEEPKNRLKTVEINNKFFIADSLTLVSVVSRLFCKLL